MTRTDAGDRASSMQQNYYTSREGRNPVTVVTEPSNITSTLEWTLRLANVEEEAFNSAKNFNLTQKDSYSSVKS